MRDLLKAQGRFAVVPCSCRARTHAIEHHCAHTHEDERWNCLQVGRSADYSMARGAGKELTIDEALDLIDKIEDDGLIHVWPNVSAMTGIGTSCHCCRDCCMTSRPVDQAGLSISLAWEKSRYAAYMASLDACDGCQDCVERCQFDAIEMVKMPGHKRLKAVVTGDSCFGCGACVTGCEQFALKMKVIRPAEFIPAVGAAAAD
ncbi:MAG: 4Fe-4S dicluster domain-containing protein [Chloroflexi bacterium]|nr:4Fe-4S dicluster domain-containing protein [Chloroflexota bacterium]